MTTLSCRTCAAEVLVRKASWQQTSIQWDCTASAACLERQRHREKGVPFAACTALSESISRAAVSGELDIAQE
ncbi:ferredoxin [Sciscionella marina]|uniref:ferredoxin n=1 Tax=Sciscionella marina TaxID=508770 RepID=UPI001969EB47|nr:ferredoxin [Sciscionella marina]